MEMNHSTLYDIACHFCVSRISGATIPDTRLSNILESIFRGQPLTLLSLNYSRQKSLNRLYQLATGQITYEGKAEEHPCARELGSTHTFRKADPVVKSKGARIPCDHATVNRQHSSVNIGGFFRQQPSDYLCNL